MAELYGWAGTILNVDLTQGKIEKEQLSPEFAEKYIGGIGFNAIKLFDLVRPKIDALSPENVMIFGVGPLAGTLYPGNTRLTVTAKSPLTDVFGSANIGGFFGAEMKYAGYDQIIFSGKSEKPVYLWIDDDDVELRDASHLWGTSSWDAGMRLKEEIGDPELQVLTIGQAGENLVRFANIQNPPRGAAGRIGMGAVMGSKNLKAVAARGSKAVKVARPDEFFNICRESTQFGRSEPRYEALRGGGSPHWLDYLVTMGATGVRNFQKPEFPNWKAISGENFRAGGEFTVRKRACFSCPIGCSGFFNIRSGEFEQTFGRTPEFGLTMIGLFCDFTDIPAMMKMQSLFDEYGMDVLSGGGIFSWAMDCYSKGLLSKEDCDGISLEWGDYNAIIELIPKIAKREGLGNLLAEGEKRAPQKLGRGSEKLMYDVKGVIGGIQDPRVSKLFGFAYRTANRGGDHLTANITWIPDLVRDSELEKKAFGDFLIRWGGTKKRDVAMEGMGAMVKVCEDITAIINAAETCVRTGGSFELIGKGLSAATGIEFSIEKMLLTGERIFNVEKAFNAREGLTRKEDDFSSPGKFAEPVSEGQYRGAIFSDLNERLDEYYRSRGWDEKTSLQTTAKLKELELDDVAQELKKVNAIK